MALFEDEHPQDTRALVMLQPSEQALLAAASRLLAARIASGQCTAQNEKEEMKWAINRAIQMASIIDTAVRSENEL